MSAATVTSSMITATPSGAPTRRAARPSTRTAPAARQPQNPTRAPRLAGTLTIPTGAARGAVSACAWPAPELRALRSAPAPRATVRLTASPVRAATSAARPVADTGISDRSLLAIMLGFGALVLLALVVVVHGFWAISQPDQSPSVRADAPAAAAVQR